MTEIIKAIVLGVVEGITEFLPISSTGHLILVNQFISFSESFTKKFDIIIQLGAILSVVVIYFNRLNPIKKSGVSKDILNVWGKTILGVIPAIIIGALLHKQIEELLFNPMTVSLALIVGGVLLILLDSLQKKHKISSISNLDYKTAFFIGLIQCLAMIPGTSRSAATIIGAILLGCNRKTAVEFSFFLAIPTMIAATVYSLFKIGTEITATEVVILIAGFIVSFLVAWVVVKSFISFISKRNFEAFGYYRIILGIIILIYFFWFHTN